METSPLRPSRLDRIVGRWVSGRRSTRSLAAAIGVVTAVASFILCLVAYRLTGLQMDDAGTKVVAYGLPFLVPLSLAPMVAGQLLRIARALHVRTDQLEDEIARRRRAEARLAVLATTDDLTQVLNRRAFFAQAAELARLTRTAATVAILDLDNFKLLNDTLGHSAGDDALRACGAILRAETGPENIVGRLGGEEFGIIVPAHDPYEAAELCERLRQSVAGARSDLTASIGVSDWLPDESIDIALARADSALYRAKQRGRNRVEVTRHDDPASRFPSELAPLIRR